MSSTPVVKSVTEPVVKVSKRGAKKQVDVAPVPVIEVAPVVVTPQSVVVETAPAPVVEVAPKKRQNKKQSESVAVAPVVTAPQTVVEVAPVVVEQKKSNKKSKSAEVAVVVAPVQVSVPVVEVVPEPVEQKKTRGRKSSAPVVETPAPVVATPTPVVVEQTPVVVSSAKKGGRGKKQAEQVVEVAPVVATPQSVVVEPAPQSVASKRGGRKPKVQVEQVVTPVVATSQSVVETAQVTENDDESEAGDDKRKKYFKSEFEGVEFGRYSSKSDKTKGPAHKAFTSFMRNMKKEKKEEDYLNVPFEITIRECTRSKGELKRKDKYICVHRKLDVPAEVPIKYETIQERDESGKPLRDASGKLVKTRKPLEVHQKDCMGNLMYNEDGKPKLGPKLVYHFFENDVHKVKKPPKPLTERQLKRRAAKAALVETESSSSAVVSASA